MEEVVITFKNKNTENEIVINMQYDKDTDTLDYNVETSTILDPKNPTLETVFAEQFLKMLQ